MGWHKWGLNFVGFNSPTSLGFRYKFKNYAIYSNQKKYNDILPKFYI